MQRQGLEAHQAAAQSLQPLELLIALELRWTIEAPHAAIRLLAQLHAHAPHGQLVGSVEQRPEVDPEQ